MDATRNPVFTLTPTARISQIRVSRGETEGYGGHRQAAAVEQPPVPAPPNPNNCPEIAADQAIGILIATAANVSSRRIRLAAYVTRLERVRGSRPSWVQIPHPPPLEIPARKGRDFRISTACLFNP